LALESHPANDCEGVPPLLLRVQQPAVPEGGPAASYYGAFISYFCANYKLKRLEGIRLSYLHIRRVRRKQVRVPQRSSDGHKVCSTALSLLGLTLRREQVGVTTDLGTDPTLARPSLFYISALFDCSFRRTRTFPVPNADTRSASCFLISFPFSPMNPSAVLYQDQSKRKETRMILFYVCVKCNHSFTDPSLSSEVETAPDG
jgi:hypothetical protein